MKIKFIAFFISLSLLAINNLQGQAQYSFLVMEQEAASKGIKGNFKYKLVHYLGADRADTLLETQDQISLNKIVDALNKLSREGWELFAVHKTENLSADDMGTGFSGVRNTSYHQYLLRRRDE